MEWRSSKLDLGVCYRTGLGVGTTNQCGHEPSPQTFLFLVVVQCERNSRERSGEAVYGRVKRGERGERGGRGQ